MVIPRSRKANVPEWSAIPGLMLSFGNINSLEESSLHHRIRRVIWYIYHDLFDKSVLCHHLPQPRHHDHRPESFKSWSCESAKIERREPQLSQQSEGGSFAFLVRKLSSFQSPFASTGMERDSQMTHVACSDMGGYHFSSKKKQGSSTDFLTPFLS
jgi:hypothetical protein